MKPPNKNLPAKTVVAHSKNRPSMQTIKRPTPVAPTVYRPQAISTAAQPKLGIGVVTRKQFVAPPVYRPQPLPRVMQTKTSITHHPHPMLGVLPAAKSPTKLGGSVDNPNKSKLGQTVVARAGSVQMFRMKNYRAYNGILAGDMGINPDKVRAMVASLQAGQGLPGRIRVAKTRLMHRKSDLSRDWDEFDPETDDASKAAEFLVVTDGHHRFIAYVEAGIDPRNHMEIGGQASFAYSWNELGNIEDEL